MSRTIIIDESCSTRLATELKRRGWAAETYKYVGTKRLEDPDVLTKLSGLAYPWVLVTSDDAMPFEHASRIASLRSTIATIDGEWEKCCKRHSLALAEEEFRRETVHRWAHVIAEQSEGSVRRYSPLSNRTWTPRVKFATRASQ